jgi:murein L,D-transpeptidase YafK
MLSKRQILTLPIAWLLFVGQSRAQTAAKLVVWKSERRMVAYDAAGRALQTFHIALGPSPKGHKSEEGDGRTPEGLYKISGRNKASGYHLSLRVSYPKTADRAQAKARGVSPGGDIFIHGQPNGTLPGKFKIPYDWTAGCIAISNAEIEALWEMVANGTPIDIKP